MDPNDDDAATFAEFMKYFERAAQPWIDKVRPQSSSPKGDKDPITEFFKTALTETKAELATAREQLDRARDLLTPEQLTQWRSPKPVAENVGDPSGPPPKDKPQESVNLPGDPPPAGPPAKPRRKWL